MKISYMYDCDYSLLETGNKPLGVVWTKADSSVNMAFLTSNHKDTLLASYIMAKVTTI